MHVTRVCNPVEALLDAVRVGVNVAGGHADCGVSCDSGKREGIEELAEESQGRMAQDVGFKRLHTRTLEGLGVLDLRRSLIVVTDFRG